MSKKLILNIENDDILERLRILRESGVNITELINEAILEYEERGAKMRHNIIGLAQLLISIAQNDMSKHG